MGGEVHTFYAIKRDEEPRYMWGNDLWCDDVAISAHKHDEAKFLFGLLQGKYPTARIIKLEVREVE